MPPSITATALLTDPKIYLPALQELPIRVSSTKSLVKNSGAKYDKSKIIESQGEQISQLQQRMTSLENSLK